MTREQRLEQLLRLADATEVNFDILQNHLAENSDTNYSDTNYILIGCSRSICRCLLALITEVTIKNGDIYE